MDIETKIPKREFPSIAEYSIDVINEPLIDMMNVNSDKIIIKSQYYQAGIAGAPKSVFVR